jgi:hypothetical protein
MLIPTALLFAASPPGMQTKILFADSKATVSMVTIPARAVYGIPTKLPNNAIWIAIDPVELFRVGAADAFPQVAKPGDNGKLSPDEKLRFRNATSRHARLIIVEIKTIENEPTISAPELAAGQILEDASDAKDRLLIAISGLRLLDVWNLETDEGRPWRSSKPVLISLRPVDVRWIQSGIHRFKNLLQTPAQFVTIEL